MAQDKSTLSLIASVSKTLSSAEKRYCNIEIEPPGRVHELKKFHYCCFAREVSIIRDCKLLVAIYKKDIATLSQRIQ